LKISREGLVTIFIVNILVSIAIIMYATLGSGWIALVIALLLVELLVLWFFRDPERTIAGDDNTIIAPADGKVVLIRDIREDKYLKSEATQISIFLSVFNVHVNRYPLGGTIAFYEYMKGKFMVAFDDKASELNEQTVVGLEHPRVKILFKQITGLLARRIVFYGKQGDRVDRGTRCGIMKFGSRMDIIVPKNVDIKVKVGDTTTAGETILGIIK